MKISKIRQTDESIKEALLSGKTTLQVCKELKTHSQRVMQVKERYGLKCEVISYGAKGAKSKWTESDSPSQPKKKGNAMKESFILNMF